MAKRVGSSSLDIISKLIGVAILVTLCGFLVIGIRGGLNPRPNIIGKWEIVERHGGPFYGCNIIEFSAGTVWFTDTSQGYSWIDANHIKAGQPGSPSPSYEVSTTSSGDGIILKDNQGGTIRLQKADSNTKYDPICFPPG